MTDIFDRLGLRQVINASGTETPNGGAPVPRETMEAVTELCQHSVYMADLQALACKLISDKTGAEAGYVTGCTAASIVMSVAATMTGTDLNAVERLPDTTDLKTDVIMQRGHEITYEHHVSQNIRIAGANVIEVGAATQCNKYQLKGAIGPNTAAALYVVSPLTVQERLVNLSDFCGIFHEHDVPVIVDAASQPDFRPFLEAGADLVLLSGQKSLKGLTCGLIAGRLDLVRAVQFQAVGIGRTMKVGKEGIISAIVSLERWFNSNKSVSAAELETRISSVRTILEQEKAISTRVQNGQVIVKVDPQNTKWNAHDIGLALRQQRPSIIVWEQFAEKNELWLTLKNLNDDQANYVAQKFIEVLSSPAPAAPTLHRNLGDVMLENLLGWPEKNLKLISKDKSS